MTLTIRQRLSIEGMLSRKVEKGKDQYTRFDIYKKVRITDRSKYVLEAPTFTKPLEEAIDAGPTITVEFEKAELRELQTLINDADVNTMDMLWWVPLHTAVDLALAAGKE